MDYDANHDSLGATILPTAHIFVAIRSTSWGHSMKSRTPWLLDTSVPLTKMLFLPAQSPHLTESYHLSYHLCFPPSLPGGSGHFLFIKPGSIYALSSSKNKTNNFSPALLQIKRKPSPFLHLSILMRDKPPLPILHKDLLIVVKTYSSISRCCVSSDYMCSFIILLLKFNEQVCVWYKLLENQAYLTC